MSSQFSISATDAQRRKSLRVRFASCDPSSCRNLHQFRRSSFVFLHIFPSFFLLLLSLSFSMLYQCAVRLLQSACGGEPPPRRGRARILDLRTLERARVTISVYAGCARGIYISPVRVETDRSNERTDIRIYDIYVRIPLRNVHAGFPSVRKLPAARI